MSDKVDENKTVVSDLDELYQASRKLLTTADEHELLSKRYARVKRVLNIKSSDGYFSLLQSYLPENKCDG